MPSTRERTVAVNLTPAGHLWVDWLPSVQYRKGNRHYTDWDPQIRIVRRQ